MIPQQISRRAFLASLLLALMLPAFPATADVLDNLRAAGAVGERFDGLLELRDASAQGGAAKVKEINAKRRKIYTKRAAQDGATLEQVGAVYAQEIMEQAPKGTWFLGSNGKWIRK